MNGGIRDWSGKRVWIIGASSGIGAAAARLLLDKGARVALSARRAVALESIAANRANALALALDMTDADTVAAARDALLTRWEGIDLVLVVGGTYQPMDGDSFDLAAARRLVDVNLVGVLNCVGAVLPVLLAQRGGGIGIVGSVAGYSGLPKALVYGATKAALINFAESLYLDLHPRGINVHLINPGFVRTPLTAGNNFEMPALMEPDAAAEQLVRGIEDGRFHIHFPRRFTNWLRLGRLLPYRWYFPLVHKVTGL
ncbi:MAG: SDR family NAD(P)-dependent oxidoreductase [Burkholderiaceae bacterium]